MLQLALPHMGVAHHERAADVLERGGEVDNGVQKRLKKRWGCQFSRPRLGEAHSGTWSWSVHPRSATLCIVCGAI